MTANARKPAKLGPSGTALWTAVTAGYDLAEHELALLRQAVRTLDLIDELQKACDAFGPIVESPQGAKANPALVEIRQQRLTVARLLAQLRIPDDETDGRRQRRGGARGVYDIRGVS